MDGVQQGIFILIEQKEMLVDRKFAGVVITPMDTHLMAAIVGLYFGGSLVKKQENNYGRNKKSTKKQPTGRLLADVLKKGKTKRGIGPAGGAPVSKKTGKVYTGKENIRSI